MKKGKSRFTAWVSTLAAAITAVTPLIVSPSVAFADYAVSVNPNVQYQTVEGWGTSLAWFANVLGGDTTMRDQYADLLFNPTSGLGLNYVRYNIGGGENPAYNYLSYRAKVPGYEPTNGTYDWTQDANQRWFLSAAISRGANLYDAVSYSPPYWMTNSGSVTGATDGSNNLNASYYDAFADYLTTVVKHFHDFWGIDFRTVEPVNEPSATWWKFGGSQEGAHFDPSNQATIIQKTGQSLQTKGLSTTISAPDEYSFDTAVSTFNGFDATTKSRISQINSHGYGGSNRSGLLAAAYGNGKRLEMSEYGDGDATGLTMSKAILADMKQLQATSWIYWQAVELQGSGWGMLETDLNNPSSTHAISYNEKYYVMGNYSKFIRPGYKIVSINDANSLAAYDAASQKLVIVTTNATGTDSSVSYDLSGFTGISGNVTPFRTSSTESLAQLGTITPTGKTFSATAKANSVTTYVVSGVTFTPGSKPNLAIGQQAYASSQWDANYTPSKAIDGDSTSTRWNAAAGTGAGDWLQINFSSKVTFNRVVLKEYGNRITNYTISYWDGTQWVDSITDTTIGASKTNTFTPASGTAVKITINSCTDIPSIYEFEVYNDAGVPIDLALNKKSWASSVWDNSFGPENSNDGNDSTRWNAAAGKTAGEWLQVDFGTKTTFDRVDLKEFGSRITGYTLDYWDGSAWVNILTGTTIGALKSHTFGQVAGTNLRLYITGATNIPSIYGISVYNQ